MYHTSRINSQIKTSRGVCFVDVKAELGKLTFYTLTAWESEAELRQFMLSGAHKKAMIITKSIAQQAVSTHYMSSKLPNWQEALQKLDQAVHA